MPPSHHLSLSLSLSALTRPSVKDQGFLHMSTATTLVSENCRAGWVSFSTFEQAYFFPKPGEISLASANHAPQNRESPHPPPPSPPLRNMDPLLSPSAAVSFVRLVTNRDRIKLRKERRFRKRRRTPPLFAEVIIQAHVSKLTAPKAMAALKHPIMKRLGCQPSNRPISQRVPL